MENPQNQKRVCKIIKFGEPEYSAAVALREEVLRKPLELRIHPQEIAQEKDHIHFAAFLGDEIVATAALVPEQSSVKLQRVAVKANQQNQGVGGVLLAFIEEHARSMGFMAIFCHAHEGAVRFYLKKGYVPEGRLFVEDGIAHQKMRKLLAWDLVSSTKEEKDFIGQELSRFNRRAIGLNPDTYSSTRLGYTVKNEAGVCAGVNAIFYWGVLHVEDLFVVEAYRKLQLGSALLNKVEHEARALGASLAHLSTFDWQAKDFYLKHGYEIFGVLEDCPPGHRHYFLKKSLR